MRWIVYIVKILTNTFSFYSSRSQCHMMITFSVLVSCHRDVTNSDLIFICASECRTTIMDYVLSIHNTNIFGSIALLRGKMALGNNSPSSRSLRERERNKIRSLPVHNNQAAYLGPKHGSSHSVK